MIKATATQIDYLEKTLTQHELYFGHYDRLWAMLEAHRIDERTPGDGTPIGRYHADQIIGWVNRQIGYRYLRPLPEGPARPATRNTPAGASAWAFEDAEAASMRPGHRHYADRNGNCVTCGAEMADPGLR
jgi:hypothetical protein